MSEPDMQQQLLALPGPRISRITIGRLHNLGNYEHVRYEVTIELPAGTSPASVLHRAEQLLNNLRPLPPYSEREINHALRAVSMPLGPDATNYDIEDRRTQERRVQIYREWQEQRNAAQRAFDELGGIKVYTDAKDGWDQDE